MSALGTKETLRRYVSVYLLMAASDPQRSLSTIQSSDGHGGLEKGEDIQNLKMGSNYSIL